MSVTGVGKRRNWLAPLLVAAVAGTCYYGLSEPLPKRGGEREQTAAKNANAGETPSPQTAGGAPAPQVAGNPVALAYVAAYQEGRFEEVVRFTCWMQDRLSRLRSGSAEAESLARAVEALEARSRNRSDSGNQLRDEGVEDQYVLAPGAAVEVVGVDGGREDLERPAKDRTWVRVTYPARLEALRDRDGLPIRSLAAGINVSEEGLVLKAGVIGNLEIDWDSIQTNWLGTSKEKDR